MDVPLWVTIAGLIIGPALTAAVVTGIFQYQLNKQKSKLDESVGTKLTTLETNLKSHADKDLEGYKSTLRKAEWTNQTLIERRLSIYDRMAAPLNDLLVFCRLFGHFRNITPPMAVERKRQLDQQFYLNQFLFSQNLTRHYKAFMEACFETYNPQGGDARLRVSLSRQRHEREPNWDEKWNNLYLTEESPLVPAGFTGRPPKDPHATVVEERYMTLMRAFGAELGVLDHRER